MSLKNVKIYSDGSSLGNPGAGGWGTILEFNGHTKELSGSQKDTTNNIMELKAAIEGIKALKEPCNIELISDSKYVVQGINEWLKNWQKNNWKTSTKKPVKNLELWKEYLDVAKKHNINAIWVKGHDGHIQNERCDILARTQAEKLRG